MTRVSGWEVVCPDGHVRHLPYCNEGDARCDAGVFDERCQIYPSPNELERKLSPCTGGHRHTIRQRSFRLPIEPS